MFKLNMVDLAWLRFMADSIEKVETKTLKANGFASFIFNLGQFARINIKRVFDSSVSTGIITQDVNHQVKDLVEKILNSNTFASMVQAIIKQDDSLMSFNSILSGMFSLEMLGYKITIMEAYIDGYLELIKDLDVGIHRSFIPMCCFVTSNIYNRRFSEAQIPESIMYFTEQVKDILLTESLKLAPENRVQMHSLLATVDNDPDTTYAEWLKADLIHIAKQIKDSRMIYLHRLVCQVSPSLITPEFVDLLVAHTNKRIKESLEKHANVSKSKANRVAEEAKYLPIIDSIYSCWVLSKIEALDRLDQGNIDRVIHACLNITSKYKENEALIQTFAHLLVHILAYNIT